MLRSNRDKKLKTFFQLSSRLLQYSCNTSYQHFNFETPTRICLHSEKRKFGNKFQKPHLKMAPEYTTSNSN